MSIPTNLALWAMPQLCSCGNRLFAPPPYYDIRRMEMLRLGLGVAIGWFAYEALQKKGESFPGMVKSCVAKAVEVFKKENDSPSQRSPLLSTSEEGKQECVK